VLVSLWEHSDGSNRLSLHDDGKNLGWIDCNDPSQPFNGMIPGVWKWNTVQLLRDVKVIRKLRDTVSVRDLELTELERHPNPTRIHGLCSVWSPPRSHEDTHEAASAVTVPDRRPATIAAQPLKEQIGRW
jgi:hypothetical protein